jgi:hypothetical protein
MSSIKEENLYMICDKATMDEPTPEAQQPPGIALESSPRISIRQIVVPTDLKPHGQKAAADAILKGLESDREEIVEPLLLRIVLSWARLFPAASRRMMLPPTAAKPGKSFNSG